MAHLPPIKVKVRDTQNIIFEGDIDRISSYNDIGRFDVYPMHANFISILHQEVTLYNNKAKVKELKIEQAVMKVKKDVVHIFLGFEAFMDDDTATKAPVPPAKK